MVHAQTQPPCPSRDGAGGGGSGGGIEGGVTAPPSSKLSPPSNNRVPFKDLFRYRSPCLPACLAGVHVAAGHFHPLHARHSSANLICRFADGCDKLLVVLAFLAAIVNGKQRLYFTCALCLMCESSYICFQVLWSRCSPSYLETW